MMKLLGIVEALEGKTDNERLDIIVSYLDNWGVKYQLLPYLSGTNLVIKAQKLPSIGISCHFDVVSGSPGANDNASSIAVTLELIRRNHQKPFLNTGLQFFIFDEEESGLRGSKAFIQKYGTENMEGLINLEMVGMGDKLALWELNENSTGKLLDTFEFQAMKMGVYTQRFDKIITNSADHVSFRKAGLNDCFTVTCISTEDLITAYHFYKAQEFDVDEHILREIISQAPLFRHYHQPTDTSIHLSEKSLVMTANVIWETLKKTDRPDFL
jgi:hypothetical protein